MTKKTQRGTLKSLKIISANTLKTQERLAKIETTIPVKTVIKAIQPDVHLTPDHCKNGNINICPAPCGACLENKNARSLRGIRLQYEKVLDTAKYSMKTLAEILIS
ncbi:MAG: hypothetical protein WC606_01960 [Candidatus Absconditabacterales bacterium]